MTSLDLNDELRKKIDEIAAERKAKNHTITRELSPEQMRGATLILNRLGKEKYIEFVDSILKRPRLGVSRSAIIVELVTLGLTIYKPPELPPVSTLEDAKKMVRAAAGLPPIPLGMAHGRTPKKTSRSLSAARR